MEATPPVPPADFKAIHKRAAELVDKDTMLAYAVGNELRRRLVGHTKQSNRHEMMSRLVYGAWNGFCDLEEKARNNPKYMQNMLDLVTDTLIIGFDILTETRGQ